MSFVARASGARALTPEGRRVDRSLRDHPAQVRTRLDDHPTSNRDTRELHQLFGDPSAGERGHGPLASRRRRPAARRRHLSKSTPRTPQEVAHDPTLLHRYGRHALCLATALTGSVLPIRARAH